MAAVGPAAVCNVHRTEDGEREMGTLYSVLRIICSIEVRAEVAGEYPQPESRNTPLRWEAEPKNERIVERAGYRRRRRILSRLSVVDLMVMGTWGVR